MSDQGNLKKSEKEKSKKKKVETPTNKADRKPDTTAQSELEKEVEIPTNKADRKPDTTAQSELEKEIETPTNKADRKPDTTAQNRKTTNKADRKPDTTAQSELEKEIETPTNKAEGNLDKSQKPKNLYVGESDSYQFNSQVNKQAGHGEDEHSVNNDSGKQNSSHQTSGILDVETVKRIVKEELSKDKRSIKMQTGAIMSLTAFFLGTMTSYWWTPHYTNTTIVVGDNSTQSSIVMEDVTQTLLQCQANLTQIKGDFKNVQDNFVNLKNEVTEVNNGITGTIEGVKGKLKEDVLLLKRDIKILNGKHQIHDNKYITYSETIFFLVAGLILEPLILFLLYKYLPWRSGGHQSHDANVSDAPSAQPQVLGVQHNRGNTPRKMNILDQICSGNLEESVCILSFYEVTQDLHRKILTSALQQKDIPMKPFLLQVADPDALSIPRCRFVFVFVDFNERNVILENPGQELGDKKVVTVKACQKMGADVFVIYTRDSDSSHLGDGKLYNKDLSAFTKHYLLKELTARNRGLSVNDETFSPYQKSHIRKVVLKK
ncbi:Hypothetical predicted protein [Mytilus galloprovincialis]|uniref:Uncharacterized protein n=1 Tax=Mytilus galloprovincialis TaxID=29158 RepID=A0A8B6BJM0_MYTGA|nr:Hypothetical predicted protein [Mytilus galloprovincialis]